MQGIGVNTVFGELCMVMQTPSALQLAQFRVQLKKFVEFTEDEWEIFTAHLYLRKIKKKELFITPGKICNEVAFIAKGSFRFYFIKDGVELSSYFCFQNEFISSYRSFLKRVPGGIYIDAMSDAEIICFSYTTWQELLLDPRINFKIEHFGRTIAEYYICCYEERVLSFLSQTPEERYIQLLDTQPELLQLIPQHYLANYLGITPVSLSRIRKRIFDARAKQKMAS